MESTHDSDIVYENDQGVIWIKTDEVNASIVEMPCPVFGMKKSSQIQDIDPLDCAILDKAMIPDFDPVECDPLDISVNETQNGNSSTIVIDNEDFYSPVPLKTYSRHYSERNEMRHMNSKTFICHYCGYTVFTRKELVVHISSLHDPNRSQGLSENKMIRSMKLWDSRKQESLRYLKILRIFFCSNCDYRTLIPAFLRDHIEEKHLKKNILVCSDCNFSTFSNVEYKAHMDTHLNIIPCTYCTYKTYSSSTLEKHIKAVHLKGETLRCPICDFKTENPTSITRHMKSIHAYRHTFSCPDCPYMSTDSTNLKRHKIARHGVKPHACPKCDFRALSKMELATHVVNKHKDFLLENKSIKLEKDPVN